VRGPLWEERQANGERTRARLNLCASRAWIILPHHAPQEAWVFAEPVDAAALGLHDYHTIITKPMDLGSVLATKALARAAPLVTSTRSAPRCKLRQKPLPVCSAAACTAPSALWCLRKLAYTAPPSLTDCSLVGIIPLSSLLGSVLARLW
jgi:hypothetical protein